MAKETATYTLNWRGKDFERKVEQAAIAAIDETMAEAVNIAKPLTPVLTGTLQGSIMFKPTQREGKALVGRWGSFDVAYAIFVEMGTTYMRGRFMMSRAAAAAYPKLIGRLMSRLR